MSRIALMLVEGETEEEFYTLLVEKYCKSHPKRLKNLRGNFNINNKILDRAFAFAEQHHGKDFDVYVCIDQERFGYPAYNHAYCLSKLEVLPHFKRLIPVVAVLMCESLFFLDMEGIYKFLKAPKKLRNPSRFKNHLQFTHLDLSRLFRQHGKTYCKGKRCQNFVAHLNLDKILHANEIRCLVSSLRETSA